MSLFQIISNKHLLRGFIKPTAGLLLSAGVSVAWSAETLVPATAEDIQVFDQQVDTRMKFNADKQSKMTPAYKMKPIHNCSVAKTEFNIENWILSQSKIKSPSNSTQALRSNKILPVVKRGLKDL